MEAMSLMDHLKEIYRSLADSAINSVPKILTGLVLVLVAFLAAKTVEWILRAVLSRVGLDTLVEKTGVDKSFQRLGLRQPMSRLVPRVAYYLLLFLFAQTAAESFHLTAISNAIGGFLAYLPNLVAAVLLLLVGSNAGQFAGRAVSRSARESGIDYSSALGNLVSSLIMFIAVVMAIGQLKFNEEIIRIITACGLLGIALAFGISFGLGTRDITRNIVAGFYARKIFEPGSRIEIRGQSGTLKAITPIQTIVEGKEETIAVANTVFLDDMIKQ